MARSKYSDPMEELRKSLGGSLYRDPMKEIRESLAVRDQLDQMKTLQREADLVKGMQHDFDQMKAFQREADLVKGIQHDFDQMKAFQREAELVKGMQHDFDQIKAFQREAELVKGMRHELDEMKAFQREADLVKGMRHELDQMKVFQREADLVKGMGHELDQMKAFQREADLVKGMRHELDQMRVFRESVGKWGEIDVLKGLRESVAALKNVDPMKEFRESMAVRSQFDQMSGLGKTMAELTRDPLKDLRALFDATKAAAGLWADDSNTDVPPIVSEPESASEMQELGAGIARAVERVKAKSDLAAAVEALIPEIRALKTSRSQRLFALLVLPIIINLIFAILNPISNHYVLRALLDNKRDVQHNAAENAVSARPKQPARVAVRVVRGGGTRVRVLPKKKARVIAKVEGGELVIFVEKRSRWALIAFTDLASGVPVYGWVYSKYLSVPRIAVASAAEQAVAADGRPQTAARR